MGPAIEIAPLTVTPAVFPSLPTLRSEIVLSKVVLIFAVLEKLASAGSMATDPLPEIPDVDGATLFW